MSSEETKLSRSQMEDSLSDLSINPFTHAHLYTTSTLSSLGITDIDLLAEFPNLHVSAFYFLCIYAVIGNSCH
jgi:hypothetical protein